jgi:hypothetical protein
VTVLAGAQETLKGMRERVEFPRVSPNAISTT